MTGMEPKFSTPESIPGGTPQPPERLDGPERGYDELPQLNPERGEQAASHEKLADPAAVAQPIPISLPTPVAPTTNDSAKAADDDMPAVAADEDLIEKEWVDRAKKIIADTKDDPYRREREVGRLQADYLKKRYGKELGAAD